MRCFECLPPPPSPPEQAPTGQMYTALAALAHVRSTSQYHSRKRSIPTDLEPRAR